MPFNTQAALKGGYSPEEIRQYLASQQPKKVGGLKGFAAGMLPLIGGAVGAVGGSLVAPVVGTAVGGAGGSALGELARQKLLGEKTNYGSIATQGALGAIPGVGKLAKGGLTAARGLTGTRALAEAGTAAKAGKAIKGAESMAAATKAANVPKVGTTLKTTINPTIGELQDLTASGQTAKLGRLTTDKFNTPFIQREVPTMGGLTESQLGAKADAIRATQAAKVAKMRSPTGSSVNATAPTQQMVKEAPLGKLDKSVQNSQRAKAESFFGKDNTTTKDYQRVLTNKRRTQLDEYRQSKGITSNQPSRVAEQLDANHQQVTKNLSDTLTKSNRPITQAERDNLAKQIEDSWALDTNIKSSNTQLKQDILDRIRSAKDSKDLKSISEYRMNSLDDGVRYGKGGESSGTKVSTINKIAREKVSKFTGNASPEYKAAQKEYALSKEAVSRSLAASGRVIDPRLLGMPIKGFGQAAEGALNTARDLKMTGTKGINKFWNGSAGAPPPPVNPGAAVAEQAGANTAKQAVKPNMLNQGFKPYIKAGAKQGISRAVVGPMMPKSEEEKQAQAVEATLAQYEQENPASMGDTSGADITGTDTVDTGPFGDTQKVQQAYLAALADGNTKAASMILDGYKMFGPDSSGTKPLSAESSKVISNANSGLTSLAQLRQIMENDPSAKTKQIIPGQSMFGGAGGNALGTSSYNAAQKNITDVITRLRTGAAITESEEKFYRSMMPQAFDNADTVNQKLDMFQNLFESVANRTGTAGNDTQGVIGL